MNVLPSESGPMNATPLITITFLVPGSGSEQPRAIEVYWYHVPRAGDTVVVPGIDLSWYVRHVHWESDGRSAAIWLEERPT